MFQQLAVNIKLFECFVHHLLFESQLDKIDGSTCIVESVLMCILVYKNMLYILIKTQASENHALKQIHQQIWWIVYRSPHKMPLLSNDISIYPFNIKFIWIWNPFHSIPFHMIMDKIVDNKSNNVKHRFENIHASPHLNCLLFAIRIFE